MEKTILIIDDDPQIGDFVQEALTRAGYRTLRAYSGTEALLVAERTRPDLALLDLMLPGLPGEAVLPKLTGFPVIVVSAKGDVTDKVKLLQSGAADYLTKPFDTRELLARVAARLRTAPDALAPCYACGVLRLDTASHAVTARGTPVALTRTEYAILKLLMQNPGQVIARATILDRIGADTPDCTERSLKQHISNLRKKLADAGAGDPIEAVWGIGFRLRTES